MIDPCPAPSHPVYVALIAAGGAILGTILKDFVFRTWERSREKSDNLAAIYARYGEPLLSASSKFMWRLGEIFKHPVMAGFLKADIYAPAAHKYGVFANYKKISTLYRLAELLAWVRACRIEFSSLRVADAEKAQPVEGAFHHLECALADGPQVQLERLKGLSQLWNIHLPENSELLTTIGIDMEARFDRFLVSSGADDLERLTTEEQFTLLKSISDAITTPLAIKPIDAKQLSDRPHIALKILDIREAWIYRDWQTAIGDLLLRRVDRPDRTYDVIGFSEFEAMCTSGTDDQKKWIARLAAVFDDVDIATRDPYDHRPDQLRKLLKATAALTLELSKCVTGCNLTPETIVEAERLSK
jgi:hypothetical protein